MLIKYFTFNFFPTKSPPASMEFPHWDRAFPQEILTLYLDLLKFAVGKKIASHTQIVPKVLKYFLKSEPSISSFNLK